MVVITCAAEVVHYTGKFGATVIDMTREQSKNLKAGTRVCWKGNLSDEGRVVENDWSSVKITWDDKRTSVMHHNDMQDVELAKTKMG